MPIVSIWVMPMGILALIAMPFGFDGKLWPLMGAGIDWMIAVALWVASLPGAVGRVAAFGTGPLLLGPAGLVLLCLFRTPLRWGGVPIGILASLWAAFSPSPDVLLSGDGRTFAVRGAEGRLAIARTGSDSFAARDWLAADGDGRAFNSPSVAEGIACDRSGCTGKLADGRVAAFVLAPDAFAEDCVRAAVVASQRDAPPHCDAPVVVDRQTWRQRGAIAVRRVGSDLSLETARPPGFDRPWGHARGNTASDPVRPASGLRPASRDVTPGDDALEPGD
jgi:competence protein ComEC